MPSLSHFAEHGVSLGWVYFSQQARHGAGQVKLHGRNERAERRKHSGVAREDDLRRFQQLSHPAGMNRPGPAEGYERGASQVCAFLHGVHTGRCGHVLVHHLVDAGSRIRNAQAEVARQLGCGFFGERGVQGHVASEKCIGRYEPEQHIGIGDCRVGASLGIAGRAGFGPRRLWPHLEQPQIVGPCDAASPCAYLHEVYRRDGERQPGAVLEAVDAGYFQSGGEVGGEIVQQAGFGSGAAHVKAQQLRLAHPLGEPRARMRPCRWPRLHQAHRRKGGVFGRDHAAVGEHHQRLPAEAFSLEPLFKLGQIRPDHRHRGGIGGRGAHARKLANLRRYVRRDADRHAECSAQMFGADSFVVAIHIGMQEADRHRLNSHFPELRGRFIQFFARRRAKHFAPFA